MFLPSAFTLSTENLFKKSIADSLFAILSPCEVMDCLLSTRISPMWYLFSITQFVAGMLQMFYYSEHLILGFSYAELGAPPFSCLGDERRQHIVVLGKISKRICCRAETYLGSLVPWKGAVSEPLPLC